MGQLQHEPATLVVLCKRPTLTQGKQRLARTLGAERTRRLAEGFLACALEDARAWPGPVVLSPAEELDRDWALGLLAEAEVIVQTAGNLGQRIGGLDRHLRQRGVTRVLYVGTDAPMLNTTHYRSACQALVRHAVVLAAASDGGVVMMGSSEPWPDLSALPWSTEHLGSAVRDVCKAAGLDVTYIAPGYDIDLEEDLARLHGDLVGDPRPARRRLYDLLAAQEPGCQRTA